MKRVAVIFLSIFSFYAHAQNPFVIVLGTAQDGGYPQIGCEKDCCKPTWNDASLKRNVVSLALVDSVAKKWWLFEATPDMKEQLHLFADLTDHQYNYLPDGIFLTHAHMGHYTGLMFLGREALNAQNIPVYVLPKFNVFLQNNGPWSQLVKLTNIQLHEMNVEHPEQLSERVTIIPFSVPHRDEYSETAGFKMVTPHKRYLFIPDIDKWAKFEKDIIKEVKAVDVAFLDATFLSGDELPNRNMHEIPHPLVSETIDLFKNEAQITKSKIYFIHFNHTNPLLYNKETRKQLLEKGFNVADQEGRY